MNFNEKSKILRNNFWMIVIIALLINLMAGIIIKIFEVLFPETLKNIFVLILSIIITLILVFKILYLILNDDIEYKGYSVVFLTHNKKDNNFVSFRNYFPAYELHWNLVKMLKDNFIYDSSLMKYENKNSDEIFQYLIFKLLNRMHTRWQHTSNYDSSKIINENKMKFEDINPIEKDEFKSNCFIKYDEGELGTKIKILKNTKIQTGIKSICFSLNGIKLNISWSPSGIEKLPIESLTFNEGFKTYGSIVYYKLDVSPKATIPLLFSNSKTYIFLNWCNEVIERLQNELDWNKYKEELQAKGLSLIEQIEMLPKEHES